MCIYLHLSQLVLGLSMWFFDADKMHEQYKNGMLDLPGAVGLSACYTYQGMCDAYSKWIEENKNKHTHVDVHSIKFCLQYLQMVNHPALRLKEMEITTTGEVDSDGRIVPAASNEVELPLVHFKIKLRGTKKTQLLEKLGTEMNKFHMNNPRMGEEEGGAAQLGGGAGGPTAHGDHLH